jgi:hypothetical protein
MHCEGGTASVSTGGAPSLGSEIAIVGSQHRRLNCIDQRRRAVVNRGHADAERLRIVQPASDLDRVAKLVRAGMMAGHECCIPCP